MIWRIDQKSGSLIRFHGAAQKKKLHHRFQTFMKSRSLERGGSTEPAHENTGVAAACASVGDTIFQLRIEKNQDDNGYSYQLPVARNSEMCYVLLKQDMHQAVT